MSSACICHTDPSNCYYCLYQLEKEKVKHEQSKNHLLQVELVHTKEAHQKSLCAYRDEITALHVQMANERKQRYKPVSIEYDPPITVGAQKMKEALMTELTQLIKDNPIENSPEGRQQIINHAVASLKAKYDIKTTHDRIMDGLEGIGEIVEKGLESK